MCFCIYGPTSWSQTHSQEDGPHSPYPEIVSNSSKEIVEGESTWKKLERWTVGRVSNAVRFPFILITVFAQLSKIVLKLTVINAVQLVSNAFINTAIAVKNVFSKNQTEHGYFTLPGCDFEGIKRNWRAMAGFLSGSAKPIARAVAAPSKIEYELNTFSLFLKVCKWVLLGDYEALRVRAGRANPFADTDDSDDDEFPDHAIIDVESEAELSSAQLSYEN